MLLSGLFRELKLTTIVPASGILNACSVVPTDTPSVEPQSLTASQLTQSCKLARAGTGAAAGISAVLMIALLKSLPLALMRTADIMTTEREPGIPQPTPPTPSMHLLSGFDQGSTSVPWVVNVTCYERAICPLPNHC